MLGYVRELMPDECQAFARCRLIMSGAEEDAVVHGEGAGPEAPGCRLGGRAGFDAHPAEVAGRNRAPAARQALGVHDFMKRTSLRPRHRQGLSRAPSFEGFEAHALTLSELRPLTPRD